MADETCLPPCAPNEAGALPMNAMPVIPPPYGGGGTAGPQGPIGPAGPKGDTGDQGLVGPAGPQGDPGPVGPQGPAGANGADGVNGAQGPSGVGLIPDGYGDLTEAFIASTEAGGVNYIYVVNPDGDLRANQTIPAGISGNMERHIIMWNSAMTAWQDFGQFTGIEGPPGAPGATGPAGTNGTNGVDGAPGATGPQGPAGVAGPAGPQGPTGVNGAAGAQGIQGPQGIQGEPGPQGPQGIQGVKGDTGEAYTGGNSSTITQSGAGTVASPMIAAAKFSTKTGNQATSDANGIVVNPEVEIVAEPLAARTLALSDTGKYLRMTAVTAKTLTVPTNAVAAFPIGTTIAFINAGASNLTIVPSGGVTVNKPAAQGFILLPFASAILTKVATDTWDLAGNMEAL